MTGQDPPRHARQVASGVDRAGVPASAVAAATRAGAHRSPHSGPQTTSDAAPQPPSAEPALTAISHPAMRFPPAVTAVAVPRSRHCTCRQTHPPLHLPSRPPATAPASAPASCSSRPSGSEVTRVRSAARCMRPGGSETRGAVGGGGGGGRVMKIAGKRLQAKAWRLEVGTGKGIHEGGTVGGTVQIFSTAKGG